MARVLSILRRKDNMQITSMGELPTARSSEEKIREKAESAITYLKRKGAEDLAEMLGLAC